MQHFHKAYVNIKYICLSLGTRCCDICQIQRNRVTADDGIQDLERWNEVWRQIVSIEAMEKRWVKIWEIPWKYWFSCASGILMHQIFWHIIYTFFPININVDEMDGKIEWSVFTL